MAVNKVVINTENGAETLIDLTEDTVTPETLAEGATAHGASGEQIVGTMKAGGASSWNDLTDRPFGEVSGRNTITLAANLTGFHNAKANGYGWFKVSDAVVTAEDITAEALFVWYGENGLDSDQLVRYTEIANDGAINVKVLDTSGNGLAIVQFRSDGVFFAVEQGSGGLVYPVSINLPGFGKFSVAKPIDTKYLPGALQFGEVPGSDTWKPSGNLIEQATDIIVNHNGMFFKVSEVIATLEDCSLSGSVSVNGQMYAPDDPTWFVFSHVNGVVSILYTDETGVTTDAAYCYPEGLDHDPGIYIREDVQVLTINGFTGFTTSKKIDEKYLPEITVDTEEENGSNSVSWASCGIDFNSLPKYAWVKVSDAVVTMDDFANVTADDPVFTFASVGGDGNCNIMSNLDTGLYPPVIEEDGKLYMPVVDAWGNNLRCVEFRSDGVYFYTGMETGFSTEFPLSVTIPHFGKFEANKQIDSRLLPEELRTVTIEISDTLSIDEGIVNDSGYVDPSLASGKKWLGTAIMVSDANIPVEAGEYVYGGYHIGEGHNEYGTVMLLAIKLKKGFYQLDFMDEYGNQIQYGYITTDESGYDPGLYVMDYGVATYTCYVGAVFQKKTHKPIDKSILPKAEAVPDAAGSTVTAEEFNALLAALRTAGYLAQ